MIYRPKVQSIPEEISSMLELDGGVERAIVTALTEPGLAKFQTLKPIECVLMYEMILQKYNAVPDDVKGVLTGLRIGLVGKSVLTWAAIDIGLLGTLRRRQFPHLRFPWTVAYRALSLSLGLCPMLYIYLPQNIHAYQQVMLQSDTGARQVLGYIHPTAPALHAAYAHLARHSSPSLSALQHSPEDQTPLPQYSTPPSVLFPSDSALPSDTNTYGFPQDESLDTSTSGVASELMAKEQDELRRTLASHVQAHRTDGGGDRLGGGSGRED